MAVCLHISRAMRMSVAFHRLSFLSLALVTACGAPGAGGTVCDEAAAHVASCQGGESLGSAGSCGNAQAASAETVLGQSCEQLAAGPGKSDGVDPVCIALVIPLFITHLQPGSLCCFGYQCAGAENTCIAHKCGPRRGLGGDCGTDDNACADPYTCLPSKKCGLPQARGAACAEKSDCASPLSCSPARVCADALPDGETCSRDDQCQHYCIEGSCAPRSDEGGACDDAYDCTANLRCTSHTCTVVTAGSSCEYNTDCFGAAGTVCAFHVCSPPPKTGQVCDTTQTAFACASYSDTCFRGVCEPRHKLGDACDDVFDCATGSCRDHVCST